ncbi:hypothetical protein BKA64DRAFT_643405 [Cadophora sp. MPI-SDFR-AT-0126]|nr:hypothetical protein BKA64DRAFT_643405 [Leotiomycetes sp. MPI-SDFR-AT-0126]
MGSAISLDEIKRYEVTEVYSHPDAKVDIVLVHGLNGNPRNTWTAPNGVFWPSQLLPAALKNYQARILVYGYNADVYTFGSSKGGPSSDMIHQHAQTLLANLALERKSEEVGEHPIIWVAHSLGGILVKRALELSFDLQGNHDDDLRSIFVSTFGVIFLGTPHTGADPAKWGLILQGMVNAMVPKKLFETHSQLVKTLQSNNEILQNINLRFLDLYPNRLRICMVHEGHPTDLKGTKHLIVDQTAASPQLPDVQYFGIEATHSGMCKFESKNAPGFTNVSVTLRSWVQECPEFIQTRWEAERFLRKQKREDEIAQLQRMSGLLPGTPHMTSTPNTPEPGSVYSSMVIAKSTISIAPDDPAQDAPYFIKPSGFRPNSLFVGREAELEQMHKMLFDKKRRADGTSAVLLQSLPGGGKTHLARQYVYNHKDDFPGGIFWLRAKSDTELAAGFWDIARKAALKHLVGTEEAASLDDPEQFIKMVRKWLNDRHDWLLVLDGIHFSHSTLRKFIPDSTNTSIIYTSTEKSVIGDHHFMNPQLIRLPLLSAREAQRLLLLELGRTEPFAKDDLRYSMELVQSMGFLPVVIHAVAQRLKTTDEPLSKFARTYSSEPRLRGLGTYIAVVEQLKNRGATEALNLINILCFFSQHIPVEMISLGLKALPSTVSVKAFEPVSGHSLNNTFKILNTFALIDRNDREQDSDKDAVAIQSSQHSQSSKRSRDMLADNVDVIRLHSVVQGFFADTLAAEGSLLLWLDRAVRLFCCSYDMANERISRKTHAGLVEDYRLYEIHGNKLSEHLTKHLSKRLSPAQKEILQEADDSLAQRLVSIKTEIDRRTPESSSVIVAGAGSGKEVFQTSIFDRTSSSSDTGPETPGKYDGLKSGISTWGMETERPEFESPVHDNEYTKRMDAIYKQHFPLPMPEDPGYDSDREEAGTIAIPVGIQSPTSTSQAQYNARAERPMSADAQWEVVQPRHQRPRPRPQPSPLYRTLPSANRNLDYRAVSAGAITPHVSHDHAQGFLQGGSGTPPLSHSRGASRGRMSLSLSGGAGTGTGKGTLSGQSSAEVSLARMRQNSPLSPRGGGMIMDRSRRSSSLKPVDRESEQGGKERGRMMTGLASYAAAVAGPTKDTVEGLKELVRSAVGGTGTINGDGDSQSAVVDDVPEQSVQERHHLSAMESLQKIPHATQYHDSPVLMPPYPPSPRLTPSPGDADQYFVTAENFYPRREGFPPLEVNSTNARLSTRPTSYNYGRGEQLTGRGRETQSESLPASLMASHSNIDGYGYGYANGNAVANSGPNWSLNIRNLNSESETDLLSLSYPGVRVQRGHGLGEGVYFPGRPEYSNLDLGGGGLQRGYSSQPMSRDPSGQSHSGQSFSAHSAGEVQMKRSRRASKAETEPDLRVLGREGMGRGLRERDMGIGGDKQRGKENRLEFARAALIERLDDWGLEENSPPQPQSQSARKPSFNPAAPTFSPSNSLPINPNSNTNPNNSIPSPYPESNTPSFTSYTSPYPPDNTPVSTAGWTGAGTGSRNLRTSPQLQQTQTQTQQGYRSSYSPPPQRFLSPDTKSPPRTSPPHPASPPSNTAAMARRSPPLPFGGGGTAMDRHSSGSGSGSGGLRIVDSGAGNLKGSGGGGGKGRSRMIEFGDYPEPVDYVLARERVLRSWGERERGVRERRERVRGEKGVGREERSGVGLGIRGEGEVDGVDVGRK